MSLSYIRQQFGVPAHRGRRVTVNGRRAVVQGASGDRLRVRFDGDTQSCLVHPTMGVVYQPSRGVQADWRPITPDEPRALTDVMVSTLIVGELLPSVFFGWRRATDPSVFLICGSETERVPGVVYSYADMPIAGPLPASLAAVATDSFSEEALA